MVDKLHTIHNNVNQRLLHSKSSVKYIKISGVFCNNGKGLFPLQMAIYQYS